MFAACEKHGRNPATLTLNVTARICALDDGPEFAGTNPIWGSSQQIADRLNEFAELGVSHMNTFLSPNNERGYEALAPVLEAAGQRLSGGGRRPLRTPARHEPKGAFHASTALALTRCLAWNPANQGNAGIMGRYGL